MIGLSQAKIMCNDVNIDTFEKKVVLSSLTLLILFIYNHFSMRLLVLVQVQDWIIFSQISMKILSIGKCAQLIVFDLSICKNTFIESWIDTIDEKYCTFNNIFYYHYDRSFPQYNHFREQKIFRYN